jgi:hypothetical protein
MMPSTTADEQPTTSTFNAESYNSWRYGDEASLYSIAEDSREDRQSEALSRGGVSEHAMTLSTVSGGDNNNGSSNRVVACHVRGASGGSAGAFSLSGINPWRGPEDHHHGGTGSSDDSDDDDIGNGRRPVETKKWVPDEEMDFELNNMPPVLSSAAAGGHGSSNKRGRGAAGPAAAAATRLPSILRRSGGGSTSTPNNASSSKNNNNNTTRTGIHRSPSFASSDADDSYSQMLGYRLNHHGANTRSFRFMLVACLFCVAVAVTVLAVVLTADNNEKEGDSDIGDPQGRDGSGDLLVPAPSPTISTTVTSQPTANYTDIIAQAAQEFAYESISACPYANTNEFFDLTVPQAEVFRELIIELKAAAKVDATTNESVVEFESSHGMGYLLERWALLMLFFSTNGEYWERNDGWYTDTDVCEWEAALRICEPRVQGEAAMTYLDLRK